MSKKLLQDMIKIKSDEVKKNPKKQENFDIEKREDFKENLDSDLSKYENRDSKYGLWFLALFSISEISHYFKSNSKMP